MPIIERVYEDTNAEVNPHMNPFMQLNDGGDVKVDVVMDAETKTYNPGSMLKPSLIADTRSDPFK